MQFLNATASLSSSLVSVDLEVTSIKDANELIDKYNGQIADGNKLSVSILKQPSQGLAGRMGGGQQQSLDKGRERELIVPSSGYVIWFHSSLQIRHLYLFFFYSPPTLTHTHTLTLKFT